MRRKRLALTLAVVTTLALVFAGVARAAFTQTASATQSLSSLSVDAASALTGASSGHNVVLNWTAGAGASGYAVNGFANGTSSTCPATGYTNISNPTATTLSDARFTPEGTYECYQVVSTHGSWSSQSGNSTVAVQLGVVAKSVAIANNGTASRVEQGDVITVTFDQAITTSTGPASTDTICTNTGGQVVLGSTGNGATCSTTQANLGVLGGFIVNRASRFNATWTWSAGNTVLTVTVGALSAGNANTQVTGTGTLTPNTVATSLLSATGSFHTCSSNTGGGNCLPVATGSF
jgi:hypothetical protein